MALQIIWSKNAQADRKAILDYWRVRNKSNNYSSKLSRLFKQAAAMLQKHSNLGRATNDKILRVKVVVDYLLVYDISDEAIFIHAIWDTRRNPEDSPI